MESQAKTQNQSKDSSDVRLSKSLSYILRHGAVKEHIKISSDGYVSVTELLSHPRFKSVTFDDIKRVVDSNDKNRYRLDCRGEDVWYIRANQGHSINVDEQRLLTAVTDAVQVPIAVHGTSIKAWESIRQSGLSKMKRNHIHLASGLPGDDGVISGMRNKSQVYIYVDVARAMQDGIRFYKSDNGVILTSGDTDGLLLPTYFSKVVSKNETIVL
ncbi:phosphotransferase KptA/Tpt1 [Lipomyces oligophaga]|uniref:phosphotransferase KptA/Tpt1 n=1 Tax=Lipomyces oligophaga TaxID=45792 RepID=UPI0034CFE85A